MSEPELPVTPDLTEYGDDEARLRYFDALEAAVYQAVADGKPTISFELPSVGWMNIVDEIKDRAPRNYSRLLRDDLLERLGEAIDRLHDEANYLAAFSPGLVSDAFDPAKAVPKRQAASPELQRLMRDQKP